MKMKHIASCGQCRFLSRHKAFELPCENLGKVATSKQCNKFDPDVFALAENQPSRERLLEIAAMVSEMPTSQVQVLAEVLFREHRTRKAGHYLCEVVYIQYRGNSTDLYFSNFLQGYVLKATKNELLVTDENSSHHWILNYEKGENYFTEKEFIPIREKMLAEKRFIDPEIKKSRLRMELMQATRGQPLSIEDAEAVVKVKKKKNRPDMVDMAQRLTRGHISKRKNTEPEGDENEEITINHG